MSNALYPFNESGRESRPWEISRRRARDRHGVHVYAMKWSTGSDTIESDRIWLHARGHNRPVCNGAHRLTTQALMLGLTTHKLVAKRFAALDVDHIPYVPPFRARLVCVLRRKCLTATRHEVWGRRHWASNVGSAGHLAYFCEPLSARMPNQIISVSQPASEHLCRELGVTTSIITVSLGVDIEGIDGAVPSSARVDVFCAGRLLAHKNAGILVRDVVIAADHRPAPRHTIIGEGPERLALGQLARDLGASDIVRFTRYRPDDELHGAMKSSGVFMLASIRQGFGRAVPVQRLRNSLKYGMRMMAAS